jgi:hypothetical protein
VLLQQDRTRFGYSMSMTGSYWRRIVRRHWRQTSSRLGLAPCSSAPRTLREFEPIGAIQASERVHRHPCECVPLVYPFASSMRSALAARAAAIIIAGLVVGLTIRYNTFSSWATDSGAYISAGRGWARAEVFAPTTLLYWAPWAAGGHTEVPLGHSLGPTRGTFTGGYPLGYPVLLGAAIKMGGPLAAHMVSPLLAGVLAWSAFVLGRRLASPWAGVVAAVLISATPVTLGHVIMPFSDVPAVAFWATSWVMTLRPGRGAAVAAGMSAAFAIMIRPNLVPLALVLAATVAVADRAGVAHQLKRLFLFGAAAALGPLLVLWSQAVLYGHPLQSGYGASLDFFFQLGRVGHNARLYPRLVAELHSWLAFGGLVFIPLAVRRMRRGSPEYHVAVVAISALGLILVNYAAYLPYLTYEGWYWLRFMLPALLALFVLLGGALDSLRMSLQPRWPWLSVAALSPALVVALVPQEYIRAPVGYDRMMLMEGYLREALPPNAVILTFAHGGALSAATDRPIVRLDLIAPDALDRVVADLKRRALRPVYVLDAAIEGGLFSDRFKTSALSRLTWPARAEFSSVTSILYYDLQDRDLFLSGDRWLTDVLLAPPTTEAMVRWADFRAPLERILLPTPQDSRRFRGDLERAYRDTLKRQALPARVDPDAALKWTRRYIRYRLHGCDHGVAADKVFAQLSGTEPPPLCARPEAIAFPPRNETLDFRRRLEERTPSPIGRGVETAVDVEGDTVWTQEYLQLRISDCSHADAVATVLGQIIGQPAAGPCEPH